MRQKPRKATYAINMPLALIKIGFWRKVICAFTTLR